MKRLLLVPCLVAGLVGCAQGPQPTPPSWIYSPYKHVNQGLDPANPVITVPTADGPKPYLASGAGTLTWAFATGECGRETWGGVDAEAFARANVPAFARAKVGYVVSTGGEGGAFTCASAEGLRAFIRRYESPYLLGIDFDIESKQTPQQLRDLARSVAGVQAGGSRLRFSFTLATHAASDGSGQSLNRLGETVLAALRDEGVKAYVVNLMVMNYGPAQPAFCVPAGAACDMGRSALQAVENVRRRYGLAPEQIAVTAMLGENDVLANVFTPDDAGLLAANARQARLAGLHYWSLDRDRPCPTPGERLSATCSGTPATAGRYDRAFRGAVEGR